MKLPFCEYSHTSLLSYFRLLIFDAVLSYPLPLSVMGALVCLPMANVRAAAETEPLSPFLLKTSGDVGYYLSHSTIATGTDRELLSIPMAVDLESQEYLIDRGLTSVKTNWSSEEIDTRFGFRYDGVYGEGSADILNISRVETVRGPNSVLYGIGDLSGMVNIDPKRPGKETAHSISVFGGDNHLDDGYFRTAVDATGPLYKTENRSLAYRVAGVHSDGDDSDILVGQLAFESSRLNAFLEVQKSQAESFKEDVLWTYRLDELIPRNVSRVETSKDEESFLLDVDFSVLDNLTISAGAFVVDSKSADVDLSISSPSLGESGRDFVYWDDVTFLIEVDSEAFKSEEFRLQSMYSFETRGFWGEGNAKHRLLLGISDYTVNEELFDYLPFLSASENEGYGSVDTGTTVQESFQGRYLTYEGEYLGGRLNVVAGIRSDEYEAWADIYDRFSDPYPVDDAVDDLAIWDSYDVVEENEEHWRQNELTDDVSHSIAANYKMTEAIAIYGVLSSGSLPDSNILDEALSLEESNSEEIGLKSDSGDGRLSGRLGLYNRSLESTVVINSFSSDDITYHYNTDISGVDLNVIYSPNKNWDIVLNYALEETDLSLFSVRVGYRIEIENPNYDRVLIPGSEVINLIPGEVVSSDTVFTEYSRDEGALYVQYHVVNGPLSGFSTLLGAEYQGASVGGVPFHFDLKQSTALAGRTEYVMGIKYEWDTVF